MDPADIALPGDLGAGEGEGAEGGAEGGGGGGGGASGPAVAAVDGGAAAGGGGVGEGLLQFIKTQNAKSFMFEVRRILPD